jgi:hypothetical protein
VVLTESGSDEKWRVILPFPFPYGSKTSPETDVVMFV